MSVQQYSVQYKGYNLIGVTNVEASTTRGMIVLVYSLINSSLYTDTIQRWWSTANWLDGHQGRSQLSTLSIYLYFCWHFNIYIYIYIYIYGKKNFGFLGRQMINRNRRLLFQQTCPSMQFISNVTKIAAMKR